MAPLQKRKDDSGRGGRETLDVSLPERASPSQGNGGRGGMCGAVLPVLKKKKETEKKQIRLLHNKEEKLGEEKHDAMKDFLENVPLKRGKKKEKRRQASQRHCQRERKRRGGRTRTTKLRVWEVGI